MQGQIVNQLLPNTMNGSLREIISEIVSALNSIRYGSVEITVHNSKVVQIEKKERVRFDKEAHRENI